MGHPPHPLLPHQLLIMEEVSKNKTQGVKDPLYDKLYLLSCQQKKQVDSKRENTDESNMFMENIIQEIF